LAAPQNSDKKAQTRWTLNSEERFIEIEIKVANQENLIEQLNSVLYEQQKQIDLLERAIKELKKSSLAGGNDIGPHNVKPPHY
jgi:SlyX protein